MTPRSIKRKICRGMNLSWGGDLVDAVDFSPSGICLEFQSTQAPKYAVGQQLPLHLCIESDGQPGPIDGEVRWMQRHAANPPLVPDRLRMGIAFRRVPPSAHKRLVAHYQALEKLSQTEQAEYAALRNELNQHIRQAHEIATGSVGLALSFLGGSLALDYKYWGGGLAPLVYLAPLGFLFLGHYLFNSCCLRIRRIASYLGYHYEAETESLNWERALYGLRKIGRDPRFCEMDILRVARFIGYACFGLAAWKVFCTAFLAHDPWTSFLSMPLLILAWAVWVSYLLPKIGRLNALFSGAALFEEQQYCYWHQLFRHGWVNSKDLSHLHNCFDMLFCRRRRPLLQDVRKFSRAYCTRAGRCPPGRCQTGLCPAGQCETGRCDLKQRLHVIAAALATIPKQRFRYRMGDLCIALLAILGVGVVVSGAGALPAPYAPYVAPMRGGVVLLAAAFMGGGFIRTNRGRFYFWLGGLMLWMAVALAAASRLLEFHSPEGMPWWHTTLIFLTLILLPGIVFKIPIQRKQFVFRYRRLKLQMPMQRLSDFYHRQFPGNGIIDRFPSDHYTREEWVPLLSWMGFFYFNNEWEAVRLLPRLFSPMNHEVKQAILP